MREAPAECLDTLLVAVGIYVYAVLLLALPCIADTDIPSAVFVAIWDGGIAGAFIYRRLQSRRRDVGVPTRSRMTCR